MFCPDHPVIREMERYGEMVSLYSYHEEEKAPETESPPQVFICSECSRPIYDGDVYLDVLGEQFCIACLAPRFKYARKIYD